MRIPWTTSTRGESPHARGVWTRRHLIRIMTEPTRHAGIEARDAQTPPCFGTGLFATAACRRRACSACVRRPAHGLRPIAARAHAEPDRGTVLSAQAPGRARR